MASPRLSRLHSLDHATIDSTVTQKAPGVYALDNSSHGWFEAAYIGRSDDDLNAALHRHVGAYRFFKYAYSEKDLISLRRDDAGRAGGGGRRKLMRSLSELNRSAKLTYGD